MRQSTDLISVVIPSYNAPQTIGLCLEALHNQRLPDGVGFEVIVVDSSSDETADIVRSRFPWVTLYRFTERKFPGDGRNFGVLHAKGNIVAFTDADCIANPDWLAGLARVHNEGQVVVGGSIENANPSSIVSWAQYFCEFSQWFPQMPSGPVAHIPAGCFSIRRWAFDKCGPFLCGTLSEDTALCWDLAREGYRPYFSPAIRVGHVHLTQVKRFLAQRLNHGRAFASVRVLKQGFSMARRVFYLAMSPLLPLVLSYRTAARVIMAGAFLEKFIFASPLVVFGIAAWFLGEFLGYLDSLIHYPAGSTVGASTGSESPKPDMSASLSD